VPRQPHRPTGPGFGGDLALRRSAPGRPAQRTWPPGAAPARVTRQRGAPRQPGPSSPSQDQISRGRIAPDPRSPRCGTRRTIGHSPEPWARCAGPVRSTCGDPSAGGWPIKRNLMFENRSNGLTTSRGCGQSDFLGVSGRRLGTEWAGVSAERPATATSPGVSQLVAFSVFPEWWLSGYRRSAGGKRRSREGPWICEAFAFPDAGVMKEGPDQGPSWVFPGPSGTPVSVTRQSAGDGLSGPPGKPMPAVTDMVAVWFQVTRASPGTGS
jgi:hypothetical protein